VVPLPFTFHGWHFAKGVETLGQSYATAARALLLEVQRAEAKLSEYLDLIDDGAEPDQKYDADGFLLFVLV